MQSDGHVEKILVVSDSFHTLPEAVKLLGDSGHQVTYVHSLKTLQEIAKENPEVSLADTTVLVTGRVLPIDRAGLQLVPRVRVIALHTSGIDNVDLGAATEQGVLVTNVRGVNADQCADFAMGLMLATTRQIVKGDRAIRQGRWSSETGVSSDVTGAVLGLIGLGQIGRSVVRRAAGFNMELLVNTRTPDHDFGEQYGISYVALDELLKRADIVCLTASLTPETRHMIGRRELGLMKPTAYFVNIARGEMVDEAALYRSLREKVIAGAGIDVFETEPLQESPLFELDNVVVTPHQAGLTRSGMVNAALRAARNALEVIAGNLPRDAVNPEAAREHKRKGLA